MYLNFLSSETPRPALEPVRAIAAQSKTPCWAAAQNPSAVSKPF